MRNRAKGKDYGRALLGWEQAMVIPPPVNAPYVPCPKCGARQWVREPMGYTCLTCGKEVLTASEAVLLSAIPYQDSSRVVRRVTFGTEHRTYGHTGRRMIDDELPNLRTEMNDF